LEAFLSFRLRSALFAAWLAALMPVCLAENTLKVSLDTNEALFTVLTAMNACGYDADLNLSDPLRAQIRAEVAKNVQATEEAQEVTRNLCQFYQEHQRPEPARTLAQYVSLALYLTVPDLNTKVKEAELPPDAAYVIGFVPLIQKFYQVAGLDAVWVQHQTAYSAFSERYHEPISKMLFDTEVYLRLPSAGYLGRTFTVYLDPMGDPGQTNARNYGTDYYVVISPGNGPTLKMEQIRHTYLHYLLDPMALKYPNAMERLKPLLTTVKGAPMDTSFRTDTSLLATECLIRAIEIRTTGSNKTPEIQRQAAVRHAVEQGFILTTYFYDALAKFEKSPEGLRNAYGDMLAGIDVTKEEKRAREVKFVATADPELLQLSRPQPPKLLVTAEQRLSAGDVDTAKKLAQEALDEKSEDPGRALFILAEAATMNRDMQGARNYFEQALGVAHEPKVVAWSHIYLGRIFDLEEEREAAIGHYRAALSASASLPEAKAAAERGLEHPYEPPSQAQQNEKVKNIP
jgi:tetratricopeptide (TPR) repeat protein